MNSPGFRTIGLELSGSADYTVCPGSVLATAANSIVLAPGIITMVEIETGAAAEIEIHDFFDADGLIIRGGVAPLKEGEQAFTTAVAVRGSFAECYGTNKPAVFNANNMLLNADISANAPQRFEGEFFCAFGMAITIDGGAPLSARLGITYRPTFSASLRKRQNDRGAQSQNYLRPTLR